MARQDQGIFDDPLALGLEEPESPAAPDEGQATAAQEAWKDAEGPAAEPSEAPDEGQASDEPGESGQPKPTNDDVQQQLILGKFKDQEALVKGYQELERKLGSRDDEKEQLRQQVASMSSQLAQAIQVIQMLQNAQQVQGALPVPQQPWNQLGAQQTQNLPAIDPEEFRDAIYSGNPVDAIAKLVQPMIDQAVQRYGQQINQALQMAMAPVQQYVTEQEKIKSLTEQLQDLRQQTADLPEGYRVDDLADEMSKVFDDNPYIVKWPNAMRAAYQEALNRKLMGTLGQQVQSATQKANATQKAAARITTSTGGPMVPQQKSPEDQIREATFGSPGNEKGIFDD